jgi:hypothetical protein
MMGVGRIIGFPMTSIVNARAQDTCPIEEALQSVCNLVLEGRYNSTDQ